MSSEDRQHEGCFQLCSYSRRSSIPTALHPLRALRDAIILSLDLEYKPNPLSIHQIGLSVLDTSRLSSVDADNLPSVAPLVSSHLFLLQRRRCRAYCYGDPLLVEGRSLEDILRPFLVVEDENGRCRNVVLVGHTINIDLAILKNCGLDLNGFPNVRACVDIAPACSHLLGDGTRKMSLKHICQRLGIRTFSYHNAAHDALYTLQALLTVFCLYKDEQLASPYSILSTCQDENPADRKTLWECQLEVLGFIGRELGNFLWMGTPASRQRRQQREDYLRRRQPGVAELT